VSSDVFRFFRAWLADPLSVGAIVPSSRALAAAMTTEITADTAPVMELGPGTGVFTQALIDCGVPEERLILIERHPEMAQMLQRKFPRAQVIQTDAARTDRVSLNGYGQVGAVLSGLPLLSMPARKVIAIVDRAFGHIRPTGAFYQFTYGYRCPIPRLILDRLDLRAVKIGGTFANLPPAAVYRVNRRRPRTAGAGMLQTDLAGERPEEDFRKVGLG
jgi:phosphatidylethanolamine/phosphatidyl-N-methylethanolamine N-methyltransferase